MNIMDGMDAARFKSANPNYKSEKKLTKKEKKDADGFKKSKADQWKTLFIHVKIKMLRPTLL